MCGFTWAQKKGNMRRVARVYISLIRDDKSFVEGQKNTIVCFGYRHLKNNMAFKDMSINDL